ncbi:maleylpyruvate isomerase N-terminal domain-containing protein [Kribbella sp. VKM Ac-2566]|uniref:maleylpyruvate isomerase N-terminal domain-containing protein n=1 Tax=Kribbella sp. VKM Ac-2566 TaxID=2512218 RepID=UPI0010641C56|nr:maleylpyruvate isomerase N-terminal domain-containing protein [Kribbella sp. VKM Ac-2566]TDX08305.1 mycothiol maleylpyruvate isomerase-like protein [Kribbella sp. VKM Ac-2566]
MIWDCYLDAAASAAGLLAHEAIEAAWDTPSVLALYPVSGLAGHLAGQIFFIPRVLAMAEPSEESISILEYYQRVRWMNVGHDHEEHVRIRSGSIATATVGARELATQAATAVAELRELLPGQPAGRLVRLPSWGTWSLRLEDFVLSRMMELVVHSDDLAVSVDVPTPELPEDVTYAVIHLLSRLAVGRHGSTAMIRALSRAERAPASIAAF